MSELTVKEKTPKLVKPKAPKAKKTKGLGSGANHAVDGQVAQAPGKSLVDVAVAAAAGEVQAAKGAYLDAKQQGTADLFSFIREEQSASATQITDQVLSYYGLDESDVFEPAQPATASINEG